MSKNKKNKFEKNINDATIFDDSVEEMTDKQLEKIRELEREFGDRYIPTDDATRVINLEEIESKLENEDTGVFGSETSEIDSNVKEFLSDSSKDEYLVSNISSNKSKEDEVDKMPRSSQKRKRNSKKRKPSTTRSKAVDTKKGDGKKNKKQTKKKRSKFGIFIRIIVILVLLTILIGIGVAFAYIYGVFGNDKALTKEDLIIANQNSTVYDREGKFLATLVDDEKREIVTLSEMPAYLPKMYIAIEDERFYQHKGVDFKRTITATAEFILKKGESDYGASTLTQQLIKNITDDDERSWERKLREITRALQVEREISKEQVLELYLNVIFVGGDNIHGVALGSDYYFAKSQKNLSVAESAFLAGINHMPNAYNPFTLSSADLDKKEAKKIDDDKSIAAKDKSKAKLAKVRELNKESIKNRTLTVLDKIYKDLGWISEEDYTKAVKEVEAGLKFKQGQKSKSTLKYSYITDAAIEEVVNMIMKEKEISRELAQIQLYNGGYKIYTTQNSGMQKIAQDDMRRSYYRINSSSTRDKNKKLAHSQASITIVNHKNGQVVVAVGGLGEQVIMTKGDWNRTTRTLRQLGSSMKPIGVAAPALESGGMTAATVFDDTPFGGYNNFGFGYRGYTNMRKGIEVSNNIFFLKAIGQMGEEVSAKYLESVGFRIVEEDKNIASLALGGLTYGVSSTQVAGAYAAIANGGEFIEPTFVLKVENADGKVVMKPQQRKERVLSKENAYILQQMMTSTVEGAEGTGNYARVPGFATGVKTGTTNDDKDRWLCGFTPKLTTAVWYGFDVAETIRWYDINPAGLIWRNIMREIHAKYYKTGAIFEEPDGIVKIAVCRDSGKVPTAFCRTEPRGSRIYSEFFAKGTEPGEKCDHHEQKEVCKVSGLLPGDNCKASDLIKKSFLKKDNRLRAADLRYTAPTKKCTTCKSQETIDKTAADRATKAIEALPGIDALTLAHEGQVLNAYALYNNLNSAALKLISQPNKNKIQNAVDRINKLKETPPEDETPPDEGTPPGDTPEPLPPGTP